MFCWIMKHLHNSKFSLAFNSNAPTKCLSLNNHPWQARRAILHINPDETFFYLFIVSVKKCCESRNTIDNSIQTCVPYKVKNMALKVDNLITEVNETKHLAQHESCECKCGLIESACNPS